MKLIFCSNNHDISDSWKNNLLDENYSITGCNEDRPLANYVKDNIEEVKNEIIILYHLTDDINDEKAFYQFIKDYPIADRIFVFANKPNSDQGIRLLHSGVHGYANVHINKEKLKAALKVIEQGEIWAGEEILMKLLSKHPNTSKEYQKNHQLNELLSNREKEIVDQILKGKTNKEAAIALSITERTVKAHLSAIFKKTGTRNRFELNVKLTAL